MSLPDNIRIEYASFSDIEAMMPLLNLAPGLGSVSFNEVKESLLEGDTFQVALTTNDDIVGVIWWCEWEEGTKGIMSFVVDEEHRNKGVGSKLLAFIDPSESSTRNYMTIDADNFKILNFMSSRGYVVTKEFNFGGSVHYNIQKEFIKAKKITLRNRLKWRST